MKGRHGRLGGRLGHFHDGIHAHRCLPSSKFIRPPAHRPPCVHLRPLASTLILDEEAGSWQLASTCPSPAHRPPCRSPLVSNVFFSLLSPHVSITIRPCHPNSHPSIHMHSLYIAMAYGRRTIPIQHLSPSIHHPNSALLRSGGTLLWLGGQTGVRRRRRVGRGHKQKAVAATATRALSLF